LSNRKATPQQLVDFVLSGHSIAATRDHFKFASYNTANSCISRAFKTLGVTRPIFRISRVCPFCKRRYIALSRNQIVCRKRECVNAYSNAWQKKKRNLLNTDRLNCKITELWHISLQRVIAGIIKKDHQITDSAWGYRFGHIQRATKFRPIRSKTTEMEEVVTGSTKSWKSTLDEVQTKCNALCRFACSSDWEIMANKIFHAVIAESKNEGVAMNASDKTIPIAYIRGLLKAQNGRCALSGKQLTPHDATVDHIVALSRTELAPSFGKENIWLAHKKFNAMKGTMTYEEFIEACQMVLAYQVAGKKLLAKIRRGIIPISKNDFDNWVKNL
jgi:5-methylcytosine-specific restriction endonuclease McrA